MLSWVSCISHLKRELFFVVDRQIFVSNHQIFVVNCQISVVNLQIFVVNCQIFVVNLQIFAHLLFALNSLRNKNFQIN